MTTVDKSNLTQLFAVRLRDSLITKGYCSTRTPSGVDIHRFAQMTGYSPQICRKYLRGQAIPEFKKLMEIATKLDVSPGWLLFGDCHSNHAIEENKITINKDLLHYIFSHVVTLSQSELPDANKRSQFFLTLTHNISEMNADIDQSKKIVDLALFSAKKFVNSE